MLNNIPQVTKNLLILNVLMFLGTILLQYKGIDLHALLGAYPFGTFRFQPYQSITHMFMHANLSHIFLNMFALVTFGSLLEKLWGSTRFFFFYIACGLFAYLVAEGIDYFQVQSAARELASRGFNFTEMHNLFLDNRTYVTDFGPYVKYYQLTNYPSMGASGAIYGLLFAFAILFPNSALNIMFIPIPIKAKVLVPIIIAIEVALSFYKIEGDNINHIAHMAGGVMGAILVLYWRKRSNHFY